MATLVDGESRAEQHRAGGGRAGERILKAAAELFVNTGYTSTSIGTIAARAGVSEQTVYYAFGTKKTILTTALDQAIAGDDQPIPTLERPWVQAAIDDPDPRGQLRRQVAGAGDVYLRAAPLLDAVRSAAPTDPDLNELWSTNLRQRLTVLSVFAQALARKTPMRDGMTADTAADIALAILSPETYTLLVRERQWTHDAWQKWAENALTGLLTTLP